MESFSIHLCLSSFTQHYKIHPVLHIAVVCSFSLLDEYTLFFHSVIDRHLGPFQLRAVKIVLPQIFLYTSLVNVILLGICLEVELQSHSCVFPKWLYQFTHLPAVLEFQLLCVLVNTCWYLPFPF